MYPRSELDSANLGCMYRLYRMAVSLTKGVFKVHTACRLGFFKFGPKDSGEKGCTLIVSS